MTEQIYTLVFAGRAGDPTDLVVQKAIRAAGDASSRVNDLSPPVNDATPPVSDAQGGRERKGREGKGRRTDADTSGANAPQHGVDFKKEVFDAGVEILVAAGTEEQAARTVIGKWRKDYGDEATSKAIRQAQKFYPSEPISYITACLKNLATVRTATEIEAEAEQALAGVDYR